MILYVLAVQMPADVVRYLVHDGGDVATTAVHVLAALHADPVERWSTPSVGAIGVLRHCGAGHLVVLAGDLDEGSALPKAQVIVAPTRPRIFPGVDVILVGIVVFHGTKIPRATSPCSLLYVMLVAWRLESQPPRAA